MTPISRIAAALLVLGPMVLPAAPALAVDDNAGEPGRIAGVVVNFPTSDQGVWRRVKLVVEEAADGTMRNYTGGDGNWCPNRPITDAELDMLVRVSTNPKVYIKPMWRTGNGGTRCLVGFVLGNKKTILGINQI